MSNPHYQESQVLTGLAGTQSERKEYRGLSANPVPEKTVKQTLLERRAEHTRALEGIDTLLQVLPDHALNMKTLDFFKLFTHLV